MDKFAKFNKLNSPIPNIPLADAPVGVRPLVYGSQIGALVGAGMGLGKTLKESKDEQTPLPNAIAKGALNIAGGATLGTLTGLSGGVLLNRVRGINNAKALNYANRYVFGSNPIEDKLKDELEQIKKRTALRTVGLTGGLLAGRFASLAREEYLQNQINDIVNYLNTRSAFTNNINNYVYFATPIRSASIQPIERTLQAPLSYSRNLGATIGALKGATEQSDNPLEPEVSPLGRLYKIGTNALGGYLLGDIAGRVYNNRAALTNEIRRMKNEALARLPQITVEYN